MFQIGQKVVCVNTVSEFPTSTSRHLVRGRIYTVRELFTCPISDKPGMRLAEVVLPLHDSGPEYGFEVRRFRPVVEKKTDIAIFEEILKRETVLDHQSSSASSEAVSDSGLSK